MNERPKLLPTGPAARWLRVPARWLRREAEAGRVPSLKADNQYLFDLETVERVLLRRAKSGDTEPEAVTNGK